MATANAPKSHQRVLVLAPTRKDAALTCSILEQAGIDCTPCRTLVEIAREIENGAGAAILTEEAVAPDRVQPLIQSLQNEPGWSDFPMLVLTSGGADSPLALHAMHALGNVMLLERPIRFTTLVSSVQSALRARRRQVQIRDHLAERRHSSEIRERRFQQLQTVYGLTRAVGRADPIDVIYTEALHGILGALRADRAAILLFDPDGVMRFKAWRGLSEKYRRAVEGHSPWLIDDPDPKPITIGDASTDPSLAQLRTTITGEGIGALGFVPLMYESRLLGKFMIYYDQPHVFLDEEMQLAHNIADHTAFAIGRSRSHQALRESEERYRRLIETASEGVWEIDSAGRTMYLNRPMADMLGLPPEQVAGTNAFDFVHPEDRTRAAASWQRRLRGEADLTEWRLRRNDGAYIWVSASASPVLDAEHNVVGAFAMVTNIDERKTSERRLAAEHSIARALAEANSLQHAARATIRVLCDTLEAPLGLFWLVEEHDQRVRAIAAESSQSIGAYADLIAVSAPEAVSEARSPAAAACARRVTVIGQDQEHHDGVPRLRAARQAALHSVVAFPILGGNEVFGALEFYFDRPCPNVQSFAPMMTAIGQDVAQFIRRQRAEREVVRHRENLEQLVAERTAELEQSHQRLRLSERMAALGTLSAGLGHDMGNLLLPIRARLDAMQQTLNHQSNRSNGSASVLHEHLNAIRQCTDYLQSLTNGLRLLALDPHDVDAGGQETNLDRWWPNVEALLKNALPRHVELAIDGFGTGACHGEALPEVAVAPHRLTQAIFNIVKNAGDALRGSSDGRVCISALVLAQNTCASVAARSEKLRESRLVRLCVSDNGPGMSDEIKARAAEPFFTTKTRGLSTGLGLSLVHGIAAAAGGEMRIDSTPGRGTTVILDFPASNGSRSTPNHTSRRPAVVSLGDERHRTMVGQVLDSLGYDVHVNDTIHPPETASIWVTQATPDRLHAAEEFLERGEDRVVLVAGAVDDEHRHPGLISMGEPLRFSRVRDIIRDLRAELEERAT